MYRLSPIGKESVFMQIDFSKENLMVSSAFIVGEIKYKSDHFKYHGSRSPLGRTGSFAWQSFRTGTAF